MAAYYLDTSALVKRYVAEAGSTWIRQLTGANAGDELFVASLTGPEMIAALVRRRRGQPRDSRRMTRAVANARLDWQNLLQIVEVDDDVIRRAMDIVETYGLRSADGVQLAAALKVHGVRLGDGLDTIVFVSADQEQLHAAAAEGLTVEDPNLHP